MHGTSIFTDAAAVEAWDAWFRWRDGGVLKDLSLETTWRRVATFLADSQSPRTDTYFLQSLLVAFSRWRLLLDERILATAGTDVVGWPNDGLVAVLNAAAFVSERFCGPAHFEIDAFAETAALAVKALDRAAACAAGPPPPSPRLRIGIIGLADAFARMNLPYDSSHARSLGSEMGRALARGCLRGAIRSMQPRTLRAASASPPLESPRPRGFQRDRGPETEPLVPICRSLTAITAQPRLALFANNVADSIEPLASAENFFPIETTDPARATFSRGYARTLRDAQSAVAIVLDDAKDPRSISMNAREAMRQVLQRWVDEPIALPAWH